MPNRNFVGTFILTVALSGNCLLAQPFFLRKDIPLGANPRAVIPGDFNGDGRSDLAFGTNEGIAVVLNTRGSFGRPRLTEAPSGVFWLGVSADFNGDGNDDLVGSGFLFLSRGDGTFLPPRSIGAQEAVAAGDFNQDGKMDLLIAGQAHGVRVFLGHGDGTFQFGAIVTALAAAQVRVSDFNRDGRTDVVLSYVDSTQATSLLVFLGQGDGTFSPEIRTQLRGAPSAYSAFLVADFNGDGLPDVFADSGIMMGRGDGSFQSPVQYSGELRGFPIAAADFTGDGYADLFMPYSRYSIALFPGNGDGTFLPPAQQSLGETEGPRTGVAVDLDGDGRLDLVALPSSTESIAASILLGRAQGGAILRRAVSAASDIAVLAPESLATLFAPTTATLTATAVSPSWPTRLGGISLEVRDSADATRLAPLLYVSDAQINFQVPAGTALGEATLAIAGDAETIEAGSMQVDELAPGLFMMPRGVMTPPVPAAMGVLVEPDGTQVQVPVFTCSASGCALEPIPLSAAGDRPIYLSFFGTGSHSVTADDVICVANGVRLPVVYAGPQQTAGVDQMNVRLLPKVLETLGCDSIWGCNYGVSVIIRINGVPVNSYWIFVR
jgi:uncharacterized protein (TIGR03437 family)